MPRRKRTRAQDRAKRVDAKRARNRELRENLEFIWGDAYFPFPTATPRRRRRPSAVLTTRPT